MGQITRYTQFCFASTLVGIVLASSAANAGDQRSNASAVASPQEPIHSWFCNPDEAYKYFSFYQAGNLDQPTCVAGIGTLDMGLQNVELWYAEQNSGRFDYDAPGEPNLAHIFAPGEQGTLPGVTITGITIWSSPSLKKADAPAKTAASPARPASPADTCPGGAYCLFDQHEFGGTVDLTYPGSGDPQVRRIHWIGSVMNNTQYDMCLYIDGGVVNRYGPGETDGEYDSGSYDTSRYTFGTC